MGQNGAIADQDASISAAASDLMQRIADRTATVGVIGLGYVGLPLAVTAARQGLPVIGFDIDSTKMPKLHRGESYIDAVSDDALRAVAAHTRYTTDFALLSECDVILICVPTPLSEFREPDLSYVAQTAETIAKVLTPGTLVVLESTTYPGTTIEVLVPILEKSGLAVGEQVFVAFSPEREDPGNASFRTANIPKIVGADTNDARALARAFYEVVVDHVVPVSSSSVAEAVKITENIFRAVNIALVNELKMIYDAMGIDVWEVIDGAATKPFGFMPFYPGPGLGGHCIPIDPFYLTWKVRQYGLNTKFIELAGEINVAMPDYVIGRLRAALDERAGLALSRSRVLVVGISYKKNVPDMRESPSVKLLDSLTKLGAGVDYLDPLVPEIPPMRDYPHLAGRASVTMEAVRVTPYDAILIATDHDGIDYAALAALDTIVVDTRNVFARRGLPGDRVVKA